MPERPTPSSSTPKTQKRPRHNNNVVRTIKQQEQQFPSNVPSRREMNLSPMMLEPPPPSSSSNPEVVTEKKRWRHGQRRHQQKQTPAAPQVTTEPFEKELLDFEEESKKMIQNHINNPALWETDPEDQFSFPPLDLENQLPPVTTPRQLLPPSTENFAETTIHYSSAMDNTDIRKTVEESIMETAKPEIEIPSLFEAMGPSSYNRPKTVPTSSVPLNPEVTEQLDTSSFLMPSPPNTEYNEDEGDAGEIFETNKVRVILPTMPSKDDSTLDNKEDDTMGVTSGPRVRVRPTKLLPTMSTTPSPISNERKETLRKMRDRRLQIMMENKKYSAASTEFTTPAVTTTPRPTPARKYEPTSRSVYTPRPKSLNNNGPSVNRRPSGAADFFNKFKSRFNQRNYYNSQTEESPVSSINPYVLAETSTTMRRTTTTAATTRPTARTTTTTATTTKKTSTTAREIMELSPSKISESSFDDFEFVDKTLPSSINYNGGGEDMLSTDYGTGEEAVSSTTAANRGPSPIRLWKVNPNKIDMPVVTTPALPTPPTTPEMMGKIQRNFMPGGYGPEDDNRRPGAPTKPTVNPTDLLKSFLKSGTHGNDPKKIAAMLAKYKNGGGASDAKDEGEKEEDVAKSIFQKYAKKKYEPKKWAPSSKKSAATQDEPEEVVDDYQKEREAAKTFDSTKPKKTSFAHIRPWKSSLGGGSSYNSGGSSSSSSFYKNFANKNIGGPGGLRRPAPVNDEDSEVAKSIFEKYSKMGGSSSKRGGSPSKEVTTAAGPDVPMPPSASSSNPKKYTPGGATKKYTPRGSSYGNSKKPAGAPGPPGYTPRGSSSYTPKPSGAPGPQGFWPTPKPFR